MWIKVKDGDSDVRKVFDRHYSRIRYADGRKPKLFVGPGEKMVLRTPDCDAIFVWRKFRSMDPMAKGICCAVFRNEGPALSSTLIKAADELADERWPGEPHYTYVNPRKVRSSNPGCCFKKAGWREAGYTKSRLLRLVRD